MRPAILVQLVALCLAGAVSGVGEPAVAKEHWAFTPPRRVSLPRVRGVDWVRTGVDAFILAPLEARGLGPAPEADRRTLLRRLFFDLTGLPPTATAVDAFRRDDRPGAWQRAVERLLSSPRFGERWAQHWLDVVRYADSDGFEYDTPRPHAWRYRDWVIDALNSDMPHDRFVRLQIAGDEIAPGELSARIATGFHRLGPLRENAGMQDLEKNRQEVLVEMTNVVGSTFLGLTLGCARCHDHKFDPVPQADYYRLQAFFAATRWKDISLAPVAQQEEHGQRLAAWTKRIEVARKELEELEAPHRARINESRKSSFPAQLREALEQTADKRTTGQRALVSRARKLLEIDQADIDRALSSEDRRRQARHRARLVGLEGERPDDLPGIMTVVEVLVDGKVPVTYILQRGQPGAHLAQVHAGAPGILATVERSAAASGRASGRRLVLARWITSGDNPLTARVMVNRLWQHLFGRGLVATLDDFGLAGELPSHPALLDWLATEFMAQGWSVKAMVRLMVNSATYRQSSASRGAGAQVDPENRLLGRMPRRRLDADALRDSLLAVSGELNLKAGGPGVAIPLAAEVAGQQYSGAWKATSDVAEHGRRSVYLFVKRNIRPSLFDVFDAPNRTAPCSQRTVSTHAGQALTLLNSPFVEAQARAFARGLLARGEPVDAGALVRRAYRLALGRSPTAAERHRAERFLRQRDAAAAATDLCLVIFNLNEFLFVD